MDVLGDTSQMRPFITNSALAPKWAETEEVKYKLFCFKARRDVAKMFMLKTWEVAFKS